MPSLIFDWPISVLTPKHPAFWYRGGIKKGPDSVSQLQLLDTLDGGPIWEARYSTIPVYCRNRVLAAQAVQGLASTLGLFRVFRYPWVRAPVTVGAANSGGGESGVPFSDQSTFSDGAHFAGVYVIASSTASGSLYDSVLQLTADSGEVQAGMEFSVYDEDAGWRMHRIIRVLESETTAEGMTLSAEISPPLRFDIASGAEVDFANPSCTMRMTNWETFLQMLEWNRWADLTAEFEEARW